MNTNQLKKFAQTARIKLIEQVGAKLDYVLTHDTAELRGKINSINKLNEALSKYGRESLIDKVAYTWFNRLVALRFMDANGYQPIGFSVITPSSLTNSVSSELLDNAHAGNIPSELKINTQHIMDLLDGRISSSNPDNEVFRILMVAVCNHLHSIFPFLFERIDDYTELLVPDDLTSPFSIVKNIVNGMSNDDCSQVEILGWLYQFYISEKKDQVFASKSAVKKEDIPAATQLFTPRWIVEYMVQNTVGKLWLQNKPGSKLKEHMPYFIESPSSNAGDYLKIGSVEEITLVDQACGSGHVLVYGFDLFYKIYEEEGYNPNDIPMLIIKNNLYGFEIDERASQLAGFAIMMKSRIYHRRFFRNPIEPNILCYEDLRLSSDEIKKTFEEIDFHISDELNHDLLTMQQATNFGSLISPKTPISELLKVLDVLKLHKDTKDIFLRERLEQIAKTISQLIPLSTKYHCVVDNPPYMGGGNMNKSLSDFVKVNYPDSKSDLMACFMEAGLSALHSNGFMGMINQHSWMFLSSYENLRQKLIESVFFDTNLHLGARTFPEIGGEVVQNTAFTFWKKQYYEKGTYLRLVDLNDTEKKRNKTLEIILDNNNGYFFTANQINFKKIPGSPIGYWLGENWLNIFNEKTVGQSGNAVNGLFTCDNDRFVRFIHEISVTSRNNKWFPYNKGGGNRKWYGLSSYVVNFNEDGSEIVKKRLSKGQSRSLPGRELYFKNCITWSALSSSDFSARYSDYGAVFDISGSSFDGDNELINLSFLGFTNSIICKILLKAINPTLNFQVGNIRPLPLIPNETIAKLVSKCISVSRLDWDSREISFDFKTNNLITHKYDSLVDSFELYKSYWSNKFNELHKYEEDINKLLINQFRLVQELDYSVAKEEITILENEVTILNDKLVFHAHEIFAQFVSYSVGCMFGRYSFDKEGLILANQGETLKDYLNKLSKTKEELSFIPDEDNAIPILNDEWFEDDIVARFHTFLKASFGEAHFQKNLAFVEECLGKNIRQYFSKDFYKDHIKRYKKRPIYWMFSSPKGYFNVLVYMHRYTPDTLSTILNGYLREFIGKLELQRNHQDRIRVSGSPSEQNKAQKEIDKINEMIADCRNYESEILLTFAGERIVIDLDDGVLVNYNKFGSAIAMVDGLNDKKTKQKVLEFDWIDRAQIR